MSITTNRGGRSKVKLYVATFAAAITLSGAVAFMPLLAQAASLTQAQINAIITLLQSFGADTATVANVQSALTGTGGTTPPAGTGSGACTFTRALSQGVSAGNDVKCLQQYLNGAGNAKIAASGAGSPGNETTTFGSLTKAAVAKWQAANGVSPASGYFGTLSQAKYNSLTAGTTPPPPGGGGTIPPPAAAGTGLTVAAAADQPAATLAPQNATRLPFTKVVFMASVDGDVTVKTVTVERQGLADDAAFAGIVLLDENGTQLGIEKTLNSNHTAILNEPFVVKAGTSRTMTVAATMAASLASYTGQVARIAVTAANAGTTTVNPFTAISGNGMTINNTLTIGSVTMSRGSVDPGASQTKEVGTTGYTFSAVKVSAGSTEKVYLTSIRWNQTGSAGSGDLANMKTVVDGTAYDTTVSSDGKYYTTTFPSGGLLIDKGFSKDLSIKGDIVGGSLRTIDFDIAKRTDIGLLGQLYGYGIKAPATGSSVPTADSANFSSSEDPWYDAAQVTINTGTMQVSASSAVPSQNIAVNVSDQPLGAFTVDVKGEEISVAAIYFNVTLGSEGTGDDVDSLTNITLVDENGSVVAGPVDGSASDSSSTTGSGDGSATFSSAITFPTGVHTYKLLGKVGTALDNNTTIAASTTATDWSTIRGLTTGNTITPTPSSAVTANTMTVKAGSLNISVSTIPIAQNVIAGAKQFLFANYILDGTGSGEDIRMVSLLPEYNIGTTASATNVSNCKLYDNTTVVTTGGNIVNPSAAASSTTFTFDGTGLVVSKGTTKTLGLKCDVAVGAIGTYEWGIDSATTYTGASGVTSGQTIVETVTDSEGQLMTGSSGGSLTVALDSNSPGYQVANSGATNVELSRIKYSAANEDVDVRQVALQLLGAASNTPINLVGRKVTLWNGSTGKQIGEATFATQDYATSSAITIGDFTVPRDGYRVLIVKGDIAGISNSGPMTFSGDLLKVDYDGNSTGLGGNYGTGVSSGSTVSPSRSGSPDTASTGVRIFKAYPKFAYIPLTTSERVLANGSDQALYKFSVTAVGGDIALYKLTFAVSSSTAPGTTGVAGATTSLFSLYGYTSDISNGASGAVDSAFSSNGLLNSGQCFNGKLATGANYVNSAGNPLEIYFEKTQSACNTATTTYTIPEGATRYFRLAATVATVEGVTGQESINVQLEGDAAFPTAQISGIGTRTGDMGAAGQPSTSVAGMAKVANTVVGAPGVDNDSNDDVIWSPVSTTTAVSITDFDYTNGYLLPGLPTSNTTIETLTSVN